MMAEAPGRSPLVVGLADEAFPFTCEIDFAAILDTPFDGLVDLVDLGLPSAGDGSPSALGSLGDFFPSQNEMALPGSSDGSGAAQQDSNEARWVAPEAGKQLDKTELQKERVRAKNRRCALRRRPGQAARPLRPRTYQRRPAPSLVSAGRRISIARS